jgi:signal peptide peptidase SppA
MTEATPSLAHALPVGEPLAVDSGALAAIRRGERTSAGDSRAYELIGGTAVVPVVGPVVAGDGGALAGLGMATGIDRLRATVRTAAADRQVSAIVLAVDSPGGTTQNLFRATEAIRTARRSKRTAAVVLGSAYSAAYALASAAGDVVLASETAGAGSIGVIALHMSMAGALDRAGIEVTEITAGRRKADLSPNRELGERGRDTLQRIVDRTFELLTQDIGTSRPALGTDRARATEAGLYQGTEAIDARLADTIDLPENVIEALESQRSNP